jgi:hypothetical protein
MADSFAGDGGQHLAADGSITYDFSGHVHATGLDIDAAPAGNIPPANAVRWLRTSDGAVLALIGADVGTDLQLEALAPDGSPGQAGLTLSAFAGGQFSLNAVAGNAGGPIIDQAARSMFVQHEDAGGATLSRTVLWDFTAGPFGAIAAGAAGILTVAIPTDLQGFSVVRVAGGLASLANAEFAGWRFSNTANSISVRVGANQALAAGANFFGLAKFTY